MKLKDEKSEIIDVITEMFSNYEVTINDESDTKLIVTVAYCTYTLHNVLRCFLSEKYNHFIVNDISLYDIDNGEKKGFTITIEDKK